MEKLTQFVSKSFKNNNNNTMSDQCLNLTFDVKTSSSPIKLEKEFDESKKPKNWLISDLQKSQSPTIGIDLRLNANQPVSLINESENIENNENSEVSPDCVPNTDAIKWIKNNSEVKHSPKSSYCSISSSIELEDSKSCPETVFSDKKDNNEDNRCEQKICKSILRIFIFFILS